MTVARQKAHAGGRMITPKPLIGQARDSVRGRGGNLHDILWLCLNKGHPLHHREAVLFPQMAVDFHGQCAAVLVAEPATHSRNIHAGFDTGRSEEVPEFMMGEVGKLKFTTGTEQRTLGALVPADGNLRRWLLTVFKNPKVEQKWHRVDF